MMRWVSMFFLLGGCGAQGGLAFTGADLAKAPVAAPAFCTRSLGTVDCWESAVLQPLPGRRGVAEGPRGVAGGAGGGSGP